MSSGRYSSEYLIFPLDFASLRDLVQTAAACYGFDPLSLMSHDPRALLAPIINPPLGGVYFSGFRVILRFLADNSLKCFAEFDPQVILYFL